LHSSDAELLMNSVGSIIANDKQLVAALLDIEKVSSVPRKSIRN